MIVGNTTLARPPGLRDTRLAKEAGGLSGRPLLPLATRMLAETYVRVEGVFPLIGAGGIDSGAAALGKIRAGATLLQLYSALVFRGLGLVAEIKAALTAALERDRLERLAELGRHRSRFGHRGALAAVMARSCSRLSSKRVSAAVPGEGASTGCNAGTRRRRSRRAGIARYTCLVASTM